jgi:hypothetical protein
MDDRIKVFLAYSLNFKLYFALLHRRYLRVGGNPRQALSQPGSRTSRNPMLSLTLRTWISKLGDDVHWGLQ